MSDKKTDSILNHDEHTEALQAPFMKALKRRRAGKIEEAMDLLNEVLKTEPRLPEPHLELAHIHLEAERLSLAEDSAREGLKWLERGGQWVEDLPANVVLSHAHDLLGQVLQEKAALDEYVFGDEDLFKELVQEAKAHFVRARELDPKNEHANFNAFFMNSASEVSEA